MSDIGFQLLIPSFEYDEFHCINTTAAILASYIVNSLLLFLSTSTNKTPADITKKTSCAISIKYTQISIEHTKPV
jgi:hypothetical protein